MSNSEQNRKIVQQGLDRRASTRRESARQKEEALRQEEAAQEAAGRSLRIIINKQYEERRKAWMKELAEERKKAKKFAMLAKRQQQRNQFLIRTFSSVSIAAVVCLLYAVKAVTFWLVIVALILATLFCIINTVAYVTRNKKSDGKIAQVCRKLLRK